MFRVSSWRWICFSGKAFWPYSADSFVVGRNQLGFMAKSDDSRDLERALLKEVLVGWVTEDANVIHTMRNDDAHAFLQGFPAEGAASVEAVDKYADLLMPVLAQFVASGIPSHGCFKAGSSAMHVFRGFSGLCIRLSWSTLPRPMPSSNRRHASKLCRCGGSVSFRVLVFLVVHTCAASGLGWPLGRHHPRDVCSHHIFDQTGQIQQDCWQLFFKAWLCFQS